MPPLDRSIAGITCREVLEALSGYIDGELGPERAAQLEAHVLECRECERFGGTIGALVSTVRRVLQEPRGLEPDVEARLRARLGFVARRE